MKMKLTALAFFISMLLTGQVLAFDVDGLSYSVINATDVEVTGRASGNTGTDIVIPATASDSGTTYSVTTIGSQAFYNNALTSVIIPDSVTTIGDAAFRDNALTSVTIGNSVTTIGTQAFFVNDLTSVIIPDSVTTIGDLAFRQNALTSVTIGNSVTTIGYGAFNNNALTSVIIPDSVTTIGGNAFRDNALTSVTIGNSVTSIGGYAFSVNALTSVIIPDSVTTIGLSAFESNNLTSVIIPDSVTSIGTAAFGYNRLTITSAAFEGDFGTFALNMFNYNDNLATITYCEGTTGWPQGFNNGSTIIVTTPVSCPALAPDAPTIDSITAGDGQAVITVTPGADNGSPITGYTAVCMSGFNFYQGNSPTSPITVSGLTNGVSYVCVVTAANDVGTSPPSAVSELVTPEAPTAPDAPTIDSITAGDGQAVITVTPGADNGSPITGYTAVCFNTLSDSSIVSSPTSPITVTGLNNGVSYACVVSATNDAGTSQGSEASTVTPAGDVDGDGVNDLLDNCVSIANPDQEPSAINPSCGEACVTSSCAGTFCVNH